MTIKHQKGDVDLDSIIRQLSTKVVKVGFFEHSKYPDGTPIAGVAVVQGYGSVQRGIPARPFFRPALDDNRQKHIDGTAVAFRRAVKGTQTIDQGLEQLGSVVASDVQQAITNVFNPPLAASTIQARRRRNASGNASTKPLVDTGQMLQAVTYSVEVK